MASLHVVPVIPLLPSTVLFSDQSVMRDYCRYDTWNNYIEHLYLIFHAVTRYKWKCFHVKECSQCEMVDFSSQDMLMKTTSGKKKSLVSCTRHMQISIFRIKTNMILFPWYHILAKLCLDWISCTMRLSHLEEGAAVKPCRVLSQPQMCKCLKTVH